MDIVNPKIQSYLNDLFPSSDPILKEMEELAQERKFPIVGPQVGRLLALLTKMTGARRILELGSGFGYSAYWFASGLPEEGRVIATEYSSDNAQTGRDFLARGNLLDQVEYRVGNALEIMKELEGPFDIIFNDIDKEDYPLVIQPALNRLVSGGLLLCDNSLWRGRVLEPEVAADDSTRGVQEFNRRLNSRGDVESLILPLRDGFTLCRKK